MLIPRTLLEWGLATLALTAAVAIATTGDQRLGAYVLWIPGATLGMVTGVWSAAFLMLGAAKVVTLLRCMPTGGVDAVCATCPAMAICKPRRWRPRLAAVGSVVWTVLAASFLSGDAFLFPAGVSAVIAIGEFFVLTLLSAHVPWIKSLR